MIKVRSDEPEYAYLWDKETKEKNRYGKNIELTEEGDDRRDKSLNINCDAGIGENPNRNKQHGFFLNADNCIGCHACEAACSEKNDNPAHIAFRSVGFVEGGTYPDYQRLNISMACNHCDDPVCLKGCPTRAYTKFTEYGAVLQDPDICFGCGYCTWVCPYNAPQLDPVKGEVSKCNMCVDRLEVGLKPSCVSACLGNALDFGVIENIPENRDQAITEIPGFPTTDITNPNIRFQQKKQNHREMTRTDSMPIKYHKDDAQGIYTPVVDEKMGKKKHWNFRSLLTSHESAHVIFTLFTQATVGAFLMLILGPVFSLAGFELLQEYSVHISLVLTIFVISTIGLYKLNMHLGKPHRFYRGFNNLRLSPVSREIAGVSMFYTGLLGYAFFALFDNAFMSFFAQLFAYLAVLSGPIGLFFMYKLYRIPARPFWDHWQTGSAFYGTILSLGGVLFGVLLLPFAFSEALIAEIAVVSLAGLLLEAVGHVVHRFDVRKTGEGQASFFEQITTFGKSYQLRNALLIVNMMLMIILIVYPSALLLMISFISILLSAYLGRILFYALVIPTTMPGAFFWKNDKFKEHAIESGLSEMPQLAVMPQRHHKFDFKALLKVIKESSFQDALAQIKSIVKG